MRIGLIDVDGHNFPNIPLMKISAFHKAQQDHVEWYQPLWGGRYDRAYMSKVFSFTPDYPWHVDADEIITGGSGYAISNENGREVYHKKRDNDLPHEIEHIYPDYSIYPQYTKETAYGFLTRGCPRGCEFCHVAAKEGRCSCKVADLDEFWKGQKNIVLCDPNMLASRDHKDLLQQLIDSKAKVDFNQGLDIRLITNKNIDLISKLKLKTVHFAYDRIEDKAVIEPALKMFKEATGYDRHKVMVYILTNYNSTLEDDLHRITFVGRKLGFQPYPMIYDKEHCDPIYNKLQRWCNPVIFNSVKSFEEYKRL